MPWRVGRTRLLDHFVDRTLVQIPLLTVSPVLIRYLPLFLRRILPVSETLKLCLVVDMYPELDNDGTPVGKLFLELVYLIVSSLPVVLAAETFKAFYHDTSVPCSVVNGDMSCLRKPIPETPQIMAGFLVRLRTCNRVNDVSAGIQRTGDSLDVAALACCIPAFISDNDRNLLAVEFIMQFMELRLQEFQLELVLIIGNCLVESDILEKRHLLQRECVLQNRYSERMILQSRVDTLIQETEYLKFRPFLVLRINDIPWGDGAIRVTQIFVIYFLALFIVLVLPQIILVNTPAGVLAGEKSSESSGLFLLADVKEELHDKISVVCQLTFRCIDTVDPALIILFGKRSVDNAVGDFLHPACIEELELARLRYFNKIAIKERFSLLLLCRLCIGRCDLKETRIDILDNARDNTSLSCRTPALKDDHDRQLGCLDLHGCTGQLLSLHREFRLHSLFFGRDGLNKIC